MRQAWRAFAGVTFSADFPPAPAGKVRLGVAGLVHAANLIRPNRMKRAARDPAIADGAARVRIGTRADAIKTFRVDG